MAVRSDVSYGRAGWGPRIFFSTYGNQLPSLSGVYGLKDFLSSDQLLELFDVRIYTYGSVLKSNFYHKMTQQDGHYRANPSNHELLTVRGVDCRVSKKMLGSLIRPIADGHLRVTVGHCRLGREEAPKHFFRRTAITSPHCQEFMVWRIFSIVTIFLSDLMLEVTL